MRNECKGKSKSPQRNMKQSYILIDLSSFKLVISSRADARASSLTPAADAISSDFKTFSLSSSETLFLSEWSSSSKDFFTPSA